MEPRKASGFTKTRAGIAIAAVIFLLLVLLTELSPLSELFNQNGLTRTDVPKYRIHVLSTPTLEKVTTGLTSINVSASIKQIQGTKTFRLDGGAPDFFEYVALDKDWQFKSLKDIEEPRFSYYSLKFDDNGALNITRNDKFLRKLTGLVREADETVELNMLNNNKTALVTVQAKDKKKIALIEEIETSSIEALDFEGEIEEAVFDPFGSRVYAKVSKDRGTGINTNVYGSTVQYIEFGKKPLKLRSLDIPVSKEARLSYSNAASAICVLDREKLRIFEADSGQIIKIIHLDRSARDGQATTILPITTLPNVPAVMLTDKLIDLRDGELVDNLPGFSKDTIYVIDYKNKCLYYSSVDQKSTGSMSIAIYDLHNLTLEKQIGLGEKTSQESEREKRDDRLKYLFIDPDGFLIGLSEPVASN